ncbi:MAG: hypothetical protein GXN98_01330 [Euryarchaeota archaeon]|nr:hypothetical protein [Euryarchaeota archaeon]
MGASPEREREYESLRAEINQNSQITSTVFIASITVTASLLGYGLNAGSGLVLLSPLAILIPSIFFITSQLESTTRIAAYIAVFLEEGKGWESRWFELRRRGMLPRRRTYTISLAALYAGAGLLCVLLAFMYWEYGLLLFALAALPPLLLLYLGLRAMLESFSMEMCRAYMRAWESLRSHERKEGA